MGDQTQLVQLFQNLISNAVKFRGEQTPVVQIHAKRQPVDWLIEVRDNGIGIDREHHERIFEIFQRLHTRKKYPGTGIGLAICQRIIQRHGGKIWAESAPGGGTSFFFTIAHRSNRAGLE